MPPAIRQVSKRLGKTGIAFFVLLVFFLLFYFAGRGELAFLTAVALLPLASVLLYRALRTMRRKGLWSVRNRLLFVYALIGVLPLLLVFVLIGLGTWALTTELAIYLANSALTRQLATIEYSIEALRHMPKDEQVHAAPAIVRNFQNSLPGLRIYLFDETGEHRFPADSPDLKLQPGWEKRPRTARL